MYQTILKIKIAKLKPAMKHLFLFCLVFTSLTSIHAQEQVFNLGKKVNSKFSEIRPTISADGNTLYYVLEGSPQNVNYKKDKRAQDVWYVTRVNDSVWSDPVHCPAPINIAKDNAVFWVSPDGNRLLLRGAFDNGNYLGRGISMCNKTADGWTKPQQLIINDYAKMAVDNYAGASLSNDGKTLLLYFSEERNSFLNDLYVSHLQDDGKWSRPLKMGNAINLDDYDEISPFLASDNLTLYYASNRPGGKGLYDIWMSKRLDSTWTVWTEPVNLGSPINTEEWEAYFTIDAMGQYGYLSTSNKTFGGTDIVRIKLKETQRPQMVAIIYGKVYNAFTGKPMEAELNYDLIPGETAEGNAIAFVDGTYKVTLPFGKKYALRASANNYFSVIDTIDLSEARAFMELRKDLYLQPVINDGNYVIDKNGKVIRTSIDSVFRQGEFSRIPVAEFGRVKEYLLNNPDKLIELLQQINPSADKNDLQKEVQQFIVELTEQKKIYQDWVSSGGNNNVPKQNYARVPMAKFGSIKDFIMNNPDKVVDLIANQNSSLSKTDLQNEMNEYKKELSGQQVAFQKGANYYDVNLEPDTTKIKVGMILTTNNILFDNGKSIIRSASYSELNKAAAMLKANPNMVIELSAHTDAVGGYSFNLKLSNDRALSSKEYLLSRGIPSNRIVTKGYGETTPVADNKTQSGRQLNRRVEFRILKK